MTLTTAFSRADLEALSKDTGKGALLPGPPYLLLSRIARVTAEGAPGPAWTVESEMSLDLIAPILAVHFANDPIVPGMLLGEAMFQTSLGLIVAFCERHPEIVPAGAIVRPRARGMSGGLRFIAEARPEDGVVSFRVTARRIVSRSGLVVADSDAEARVGDKLVAQAKGMRAIVLFDQTGTSPRD